MKNRALVCFSCLVLLAGFIGYQTVAYFTSASTTTNVISTGYVEIELYEYTTDEDGNLVALSSDTVAILPGDVVDQVPYVENTGSEPSYIRVWVDVTVAAADGSELDASVVTLDIDTEEWVLDEDGWYRYTGIVQPGDLTPAVFTSVSFSTEMDNSYSGCVINIEVDSQSVQSEYNEYDESAGETVLDVNGFPEEGTE